MKLTPQERADRRKAFRRMNAPEKLEYIWSYYKFPVILTVILIYIIAYGTYRHFSRKEILFYAACVNVSVNEDTENILSEGFLRFSGNDDQKKEVYLYRALYLSDDSSLANHEYAYASRLKLMAAVNTQQLDIVLMNREAYDLLSASGYLLELPDVLERENPELFRKLQPFLVENDVILDDNALEHALDETQAYHSMTAREINAVEISGFPVFSRTDFTGELFTGVMPNTPRLDCALAYLNYLASDASA